MLCYRDSTFCAATDCRHADCSRLVTDEIRVKAGDLGLPIARIDIQSTCADYEPPLGRMIKEDVMRRVTALMIAIMLSSQAVADDAFLVRRDPQGKTTVEGLGPDRYGSRARHDAWGTYQGTVEVNRYGEIVLRAPGGRIEQVIQPPAGATPPQPWTTGK